MLRFIYCQPIIYLVLVIIVLDVLSAHINNYLKNIYKKTIFNTIFLMLALFCVLYCTVLARSVGEHYVELRPFYTFILAQSQVEYYRTFFMNALLFVPLGLSMPYLLSKKAKRLNVFTTIAFAMLLSAGIEFLQYRLNLGVCETDDVIANTLGAAIGALSYCLYMKILKNQEKGSLMQKINNNQTLLLDLCAKALFDKNISLPEAYDVKEIVKESVRQTVFPVIYSLIKDKCDDTYDKRFSQIIAKNIRVEFAHNEVHRVLSENNISYVVLKGVASASYYKEPMLRMMGDVDVLVSPENITKADKLLKSIGFVTTDNINGDDMHIGYKRKDGVSCELHRRIGWAPNNSVGDTVNKYLDDIFEKSGEYKMSNGSCIVPCKFHHGLILLLHTATHLTHEGVGLRHLCDWAVFVNSFSNDEFVDLFEKPLKDMGLWRFAQLLTLCCVKYLGCDPKEWAGECEQTLLEDIITDILNGGNFGFKDTDRYNQIKYISDRENGTTSKRNPVLQVFYSINAKTKTDFDFVNKIKILLPLGWVLTIFKYLYLVLIGKRSLDNASTIKGAQNRKKIYDEFKLYKNDQD